MSKVIVIAVAHPLKPCPPRYPAAPPGVNLHSAPYSANIGALRFRVTVERKITSLPLQQRAPNRTCYWTISMYRWIEKVGLRRAFHTGSPRWQAVAPEAQGPSKKNGFDAQEWLRRVRRSHFAFVFSTRWASFRN